LRLRYVSILLIHEGWCSSIVTKDAKNSPFIRFAEGAPEGKYQGYGVFTALVEAMVTKVDKEERGVGMQNFTFAPAWDEFVALVSIQSPRTHALLRDHFATRTLRNIRSVICC
jgi:hypothetical protein